MSLESTTGRGRWRESRSPRQSRHRGPSRARRWASALLVVGLISAVVSFLIWIGFQFLFLGRPRTVFAPFWIAEYQKPQLAPLPGMEAERKAMLEAAIFASLDADPAQTWNPTIEIVRTRLANLKRLAPDESLVVYLAADALVDERGEIQILASDSDPYNLRLLIPLREVIDRVQESPPRNKLVVLDLMRTSRNPFDIGGTPDGVADLVQRCVSEALEAKQPAGGGLWVLAACSPGQAGLWSETVGESVFGHFFRECLRDQATDRDGRGTISVRELAAAVAQKADSWARHYRGVGQRAVLLGNARDFELAALDSKRPEPAPKSPEPQERTRGGKPATSNDATDGRGPNDQGGRGPSDRDATASDGSSETQNRAAEPSSKGTAPRPDADAPPEGDYPEWLQDGWSLYGSWWNEPGTSKFPGAAAPRVFRRLGALLLRTELRWRDRSRLPDPVEIGKEIETLKEALRQAESIPRPPFRSVGQALSLGWSAEPELVSRLRAVIEMQRTLARGTEPNPEGVADLKKQSAEIVAAVKGKPGPALELAGTIVAALEDQRFDTGTVQFLDGLVDDAKLARDILELRTLKDLAQRARRAGRESWSEETVKLAWDTMILGEQLNNRPASLPWLRARLDRADALGNLARVATLDQAHGFAAWSQIAELWEATRTELVFAASCQETIEDAATTLDRARALLPEYLPFLDATAKPALDQAWLSAIEAATLLQHRLVPPTGEGSAAFAAREQLELLSSELGAASRRLKNHLATLERPFQPDAVQALMARAHAAGPGSPVGGEIEALLGTPFLRTPDRLALWKAMVALDRRLGGLSIQPNIGPDTADDPNRADQVRDQVARRARRLAALLDFAGEETTARNLDASLDLAGEINAISKDSASQETAQAKISRAWSGLARVARFVDLKLATALDQQGRLDRDDRAGWIVPVFLLDLQDNPTRRQRERQFREAWSRLADRYRHRSLDLREPVEPVRFYETAALECPGVGPAGPLLALELSLAAAIPPLSSRQSTVEVQVRALLRGSDPENPQPVAFETRSVADPRLRVSAPSPAAIELTPDRPRVLTINASWDEQSGPSSAPPPPGFIVRGMLPDGRAFHLLVPLRIEWTTILPKLALSRTRGELTAVAADPLRLRALGVRQPFFVFIRNPGPSPREVVVEVLDGEAVVASSEPKPLPIPGSATVLVPGFGAPAPKEGELLPEAPRELRLRLRDASGDQEFDTLRLAPVIAEPDEYLEVTPPRFTPARPGEPNRLMVGLRSLPQMAAPAARVELELPSDPELFPALRGEPQGRLVGLLDPGTNLELVAEALKLDPTADESGIFWLNIDGIRRARWFRTSFVQEGGVQLATEVQTPRVRFQAEPKVGADQPATLRIRFEVDHVPPDATLVFRMGRTVGTTFVDDLLVNRPAKKRHLGFDPRGEGGALLFEATIEDWDESFDVRSVRGLRLLHAFLFDGRGRSLADWGTQLMLDDLPPQDAAIAVPKSVDQGTARVEVKATVTPPVSGVKDVRFVIGPKASSPADFAQAVEEGRAIRGRATAADRSAWTASVAIPKDASGTLVVTARLTSGVGLSAFVSEEIALRERPSSDANSAAASPPAPKLGAIVGKVLEGKLAQSGLTVYLIDPSATDPAKKPKSARTRDDGSFEFQEIEPGSYILFCRKETGRLDRQAVEVEAGQTAAAKLELHLP